MKLVFCCLLALQFLSAQGAFGPNGPQNGQQNLDSYSDSLSTDSLFVDSLADEPTYVQREFDHKEQVIVGGVMMLIFGIMIVSQNNFNPQHQSSK